MSRATLCGLSAALCLLVLAGPAVAAPPANDERTSPQGLTLPASVVGTTRQATLESDEPASCENLKASVWYSVTAASADRIVVRVAAAGNLDAVVDVFRRARSQLSGVDCDATDEQGKAELVFRPQPGVTYLIRVGQRANSVAGDFRLDVFAPQPPPRPPGRTLPRRGASHTLDEVQDAADAWSARMRSGVSYRVNLAQPVDGCVSVALYPPGTRDFDGDRPVRYLGCGGYTVFTPGAGEGGRYSLLVTAQRRRRGPQRYHLEVARAGRDDLAPGLPLANYRRVRGRLNAGRIDVVDLYRFSLARRSDVQLSLGGAPFGLRVLSDRGRGVGGGAGELEQQLRPGRYYVAVTASGRQRGRYVLRLAARTITATSIAIDGSRTAAAAPRRTVSVQVGLAPATSGPVRVTLEHFDPLAGWQFFREVAVRALAGRAALRFRPPSQGRWRASARFLGTRTAAPSQSGYATLLVAPPLGIG